MGEETFVGNIEGHLVRVDVTPLVEFEALAWVEVVAIVFAALLAMAVVGWGGARAGRSATRAFSIVVALGACGVLTAGFAIFVGIDGWHAHYGTWASASAGATTAFVNGVGVLAEGLGIPHNVATIFAAVVVINFIRKNKWHCCSCCVK